MWKWYSTDEPPPASAGALSSPKNAGDHSMTDIIEQLAQNEQLVLQLKDLIREKDNQLHVKDQQLKEDKEAFEAKISKMKLQSKAKITSLSAQLEDVKKQLGASGSKEQASGKHKQSTDGEQEYAAANRGKILMLRKRIEELESQAAKKDSELKNKFTELEAQLQRGAEMDVMLAEKDMKLAEKEAYIIELQLAAVSGHPTQQIIQPNKDNKMEQDQIGLQGTSISDLQSMVHHLTRKVEESEERFSLLQEQATRLKDQLSKGRTRYEEKEAMYMKNICVFQEMIQEKENKLSEQMQKHEQELFLVAAKSDASADFDQLLKALKQKLHEKEEVLMGRTQVVGVLQKELDGRDQQIKEMIEKMKLLQLEKDNLEAKLDAEKHVMRAQVRDLMERHESELKNIKGKHSTELHGIREKHEEELSQKEQSHLQVQKQLEDIQLHGQVPGVLDATATMDVAIKEKIEELEEQVKLKTEEAAKSEAKFLKMKAWSKSKIRQAEEDLKNAQTGASHQEQMALKKQVAELEKEKEGLQQKVNCLQHFRAQNEELLAKLELYEEQQQKMQADLEQVTKRATSQTSESGSAEELQSRLIEWQEMVLESARGHAKDERGVMELRMTQIEEEREALVSGQQELEEELGDLQRLGEHQGRMKLTTDGQKLEGDYEYEDKQHFEEPSINVDHSDAMDGENLGGLWPEYSSHHTGLRAVVEELEVERNRLQEQILMLEERCQDLEDRAQLRARVEFHQNESERLQNQLSLLRSQQSREFEQHQHLVSSLNEQLKGVSDRKDYLETSLAEKEHVLAETLAKLTQLNQCKESLTAQEITSQNLAEKLLHAEEDLGCVMKKCSAFEVECGELKNTVLDLSEKLSSNNEKVQKQEAAMEGQRQDLEQANDELERLNLSHLEERARLIADLQSCEREIDALKEIIVEKEHENSALSDRMMEYSDENEELKEQNRSKEQETGELQVALIKVEREILLLKETQSADSQTMNNNLSLLVDQLSNMESDLHNAKSELDAKEKKIVILMDQIRVNNDTIQNLHSELHQQNVLNQAHLAECGPRILSLENKVAVTTGNLQEIKVTNQKEIEKLKAQLAESSSAKEKLLISIQEKEEKELCLENELKALKNHCNNLVAENIGKEDELGKLFKQMEARKEAEGKLQEMQGIVASLEQKLQVVEEKNSQLMLEVQTKETERKDLKKQMDEMSKLVIDLQNQTKTLDATNVQLRVTVEDQVRSLSEQVNLVTELKDNAASNFKLNSILECSMKDMSIENESLKALLSDKENELWKQNDVVQQLESKIASEVEQILQHKSMIFQLQQEKEALTAKLELSKALEEKRLTVEQQLHEKINECNTLKDEILEHRQTTEQIQWQMQSVTVQLEELQLSNHEKEVALNSKSAESTSIQILLHKEQEATMELQDQVQTLGAELGVKTVALEEKLSELDGLQETLSQQHLTIRKLESQVQELREGSKKLRQWLNDKESLLNVKSVEGYDLQGQLDQKTDMVLLLQKQMDVLNVDKEHLQNENKELQASLSKWTAEHSQLQRRVNEYELTASVVQDQTQALGTENCRLAVELEAMKSDVQNKDKETASLQDLLSLKEGTIISLNKQVNDLNATTRKLNLDLEEKQRSLDQQAILLQQLQARISQNEEQFGQCAQKISDLQHQEQVLQCEARQLKLTLQEKEKALHQQIDECGHLQKKAAEHGALKVQSMETISKLENQIQDLTFKAHELKRTLEERDSLLACKVEDCVKLKTAHSEMDEIVLQLKAQLATASSEAKILKSTIKEKELSLSQIKEGAAACKKDLMLQMEVKETRAETLRQKFIDLEHSFSQLSDQVKQQNSEMNQLRETIACKEASILEQSKLVKKLENKASESDLLKSQFNESTEMVSELQSKVQCAYADSKQREQLLEEKETAFSHLQERYAAQSEQFKELHRELSRKNEEIAGFQTVLREKDVIIQTTECNANTLMAEIGSLKEQLQKSHLSLNHCENILKQKEEMLTINQKNMDSRIAALSAQNLQYKEAIEQLELVNHDLKQNDTILQSKYSDQVQHVKNLEVQLKNLNEKSVQDHQERLMQIDNLHQQCDQLRKENSALDCQLNTVRAEKEEMNASNQKRLQQKSEELEVLEEKLVKLCEVQQLEVSQQLRDENEYLQKQVSLKSEEILIVKLEVQKLEQSLKESERNQLAELDKETEQNSLQTEKLNFLGNQIESKDVKIDSLQKDLDNLQEKFSKQTSQLQITANHLKEQESLVSNLSQKLIEKQSGLDELSALVSNHEIALSELKLALSEKEKEIEKLQSSIAVSEHDILESTKSFADKLMCFEEEKLLLHNELTQTKLNHQLELKNLHRQIADLQGKLEKSQGQLSERETASDESLQQSSSLQEQLKGLELELEKKSQHLEDAVNEGAKHFDNLQKKEHERQILAMQITQQQELVASFSQQLREEDVSTMQLSKSISREMVKTADVEKHLTDEMQELKLRNCVSNEKIARFTCELEQLKKQLEKQDALLNAKEEQYQGIATENEQLRSQTQVLTKEWDLLKKKFQAALLTRRDLMKKVEELQQAHAADLDKSKQVEELQSSCRMLESQVRSGQKEFKELEVHLEILKQQLLEKDGDINILSETLSTKEAFIEKLQKNVSQCEAEKGTLSAELFKIVKEKDSSISQLQSILAEKEKAFEDERYQYNSNLKTLKTALSKIPEYSNTQLPDKTQALSDGGVTEIVDKLNELQQEKEHLQKKLKAALLARKETIKKAQEKDRHHKEQLSQQEEEYNHMLENLSAQSKELEDVKEELVALQAVHQRKQTELEHKEDFIWSLEKQLHSANILLKDKEKMVEQLKVQLEEEESKMLTFEGQRNEIQALENKLAGMISTLSDKEAAMKNHEDSSKHLQQEKMELGYSQARLAEKSEEVEMLKQSIISLEQQLQEEKERQTAEILWLQNHWNSTQGEAQTLKIALEEAMKDKENYSHSLATKAADMDCLKTQLLDLNSEKDNLQTQLAAFQVQNAELKAVLKESWPPQEEERVDATPLLAVQSELVKACKNLEDRESAIKLLEGTLSEKEKHIEELELQIQKQAIFHNAQNERTKACTSQVQQRSADSSEENKSKELMQRKLQAALVSRREVLKVNKSLKHDINVLTSEKEELFSKISTLERNLSQTKEQLELLQQAALVHQEEKRRLLFEVDSVFAEKQNLSAVCESLKQTLEILTQEKQQYSHQLDSLKNSQTAELSEWKLKHNELKHEYESLLQSYENIGNEMDKMRQIVETARKEKQDVFFRLRDVEAERRNTERQLEEAADENEKVKEKMRKFAKSKQQRVQELEEEIEKMRNELQAISTAKQSHTSELSAQYNQLWEENLLLKQTFEDLKTEFDKTQKEREYLLNEFNSSLSIMEELQDEDAFDHSNIKSPINEPLSSEMQSLEDTLTDQEEEVSILEQTRPLLSEKIHQLGSCLTVKMHERNSIISQLQQGIKACQLETVNLNEKVKILEDDKSLLQEELENVQEMSDKVKNEKEYLEAELLQNVDKIDQLTEALKTLHLQNESLVNELDCFKEEKRHLIREKEAQEVKLVREFEERLRSAQRGKTTSKSETKELQELLKEKHQEIIQLQKDCIKYQELILDLERSVKTSESTCEGMGRKLESMTAKASDSERQVKFVQEELATYKVLLRDTRTEAESTSMKCSRLIEDLRKNEEKTKAQITEKEKELLEILDQQKTIHQKEMLSYQDKLDLMERDKDRVVGEILELQAEINGRDLFIKKLRDELNNNLAKLAAFTKSMSSLQDDRDRIIEEAKKWETRFQDTIQSKENQVQVKEEMLQKLNEEVKIKSFNLQELQFRASKLEQTINELSAGSVDAEIKHRSEMIKMKEVICKQSEKIEEMEGSLKDKEAAMSKLLQENDSLGTQLSDASRSVTELKVSEQALIKDLADKECESHQLQTENEKLQADLRKQGAISQQLKLMLTNKDAEISKLVSSKDSEISEYVLEAQQQQEKQVDDYEKKLKILHQDNQRGASDMKEFKVQLNKVREERDKAVGKVDAFTKSMASLQDDRDRILSEYMQLEQRHLDMLSQKDGIIQESATENNEMKQELRNMLNQVDDLNSENAMLKAQLAKYREELNQVLSLKDNQLKELLQKHLQQIKNLENERSSFEEQWRVAQSSLEKSNESLTSLQEENTRILEQFTEHKAVGSQKEDDKSEASKRLLILELQKKLEEKTMECEELKRESNFRGADFKELESKFTEVENLAQLKEGIKTSESSDGILHEQTEEKLVGSSFSMMEQRLLDVINENKEFASRTESFEKMLMALQSERDRLLLDISQLQIRQTDDLKGKGAGLEEQKLRKSAESSEITWFKNKVEELEKLVQQAKLQEHTEQDLSSCQNELAELRSEKNLLLSESEAMKEQYVAAVAGRDRQIAELRKLNQEAWHAELGNVSDKHQIKPLETVSLLGTGNVADQIKTLLVEKKQLQSEAQGYLQEIHQKELQFQQLNSKLIQVLEDRSALTSQLKTASQNLRDTQSRYGDLQDRHYILERQYQALRSSFQHEVQHETSEDVPPGAPQERASIIVEIDNLELNELRRRLAESEQHNASAHQELAQLAEMLTDEELRRRAAEEALLAAEERLKGLDSLPVKLAPREYTIQLESDEEREALIIDPSEQVVVRKVKRGALSFKRWLRGRSLYCSKLMSSRSRSRYLVFAYFVTLHVLVFMCLAGHL